jgi:hypothetical protein
MALSESQYYYDFENEKVFLPVQVAKLNVEFRNFFLSRWEVTSNHYDRERHVSRFGSDRRNGVANNI